MPCYDSRDSNCNGNEDELQETINVLTRYLCEVLRSIESFDYLEDVTRDCHSFEEIREWWRDHKLADIERISEEFEGCFTREERKLILSMFSSKSGNKLRTK
jgi:hypothetical protein